MWLLQYIFLISHHFLQPDFSLFLPPSSCSSFSFVSFLFQWNLIPRKCFLTRFARKLLTIQPTTIQKLNPFEGFHTVSHYIWFYGFNTHSFSFSSLFLWCCPWKTNSKTVCNAQHTDTVTIYTQQSIKRNQLNYANIFFSLCFLPHSLPIIHENYCVEIEIVAQSLSVCFMTQRFIEMVKSSTFLHWKWAKENVENAFRKLSNFIGFSF